MGPIMEVVAKLYENCGRDCMHDPYDARGVLEKLVAAERERCQKIVEAVADYGDDDDLFSVSDAVEAIRDGLTVAQLEEKLSGR